MGEYICVWPNGDWCYESDLEEWLMYHSDDYELIDTWTTRAEEIIGEY